MALMWGAGLLNLRWLRGHSKKYPKSMGRKGNKCSMFIIKCGHISYICDIFPKAQTTPMQLCATPCNSNYSQPLGYLQPVARSCIIVKCLKTVLLQGIACMCISVVWPNILYLHICTYMNLNMAYMQHVFMTMAGRIDMPQGPHVAHGPRVE